MYGTVASFDSLMQFFCKLQQGKTEKVAVIVTQLEQVLNLVQQEYPIMLSASEVQNHLRDHLFFVSYKQVIPCTTCMMTWE